jgi:hypothetical protein
MKFVVTEMIFRLERWYETLSYWAEKISQKEGEGGCADAGGGECGDEYKGISDFVIYVVDHILFSDPNDNTEEKTYRIQELMEFGEYLPFLADKITPLHMDLATKNFTRNVAEFYRRLIPEIGDMFVTWMMCNDSVESLVEIMREDQSRCNWQTICEFVESTQQECYRDRTVVLLRFLNAIIWRRIEPSSNMRNVFKKLIVEICKVDEEKAEDIMKYCHEIPLYNNTDALRCVIEKGGVANLMDRISVNEVRQIYGPILFDSTMPVKDRIEAYFHWNKIATPSVPDDMKYFFELTETYGKSTLDRKSISAIKASKDIQLWLAERGLEWLDCIVVNVSRDYFYHPYKYRQILIPEGNGYRPATTKETPDEESRGEIVRMIGDYIIYHEGSVYYCLDRDGYTICVLTHCAQGVYRFMPNGLTPTIGPGVMIKHIRQDGTVWNYVVIPSKTHSAEQWTIEIQHSEHYIMPVVHYNGNLLLVTLGGKVFNTECALNYETFTIRVYVKEKIANIGLGKAFLGKKSLYVINGGEYNKNLSIYDLSNFPKIDDHLLFDGRVRFTTFTSNFESGDICCLFSPAEKEPTYPESGSFCLKDASDLDGWIVTSDKEIIASSSIFSGFMTHDGILVYYNETSGSYQSIKIDLEIIRQAIIERNRIGYPSQRTPSWMLCKGRDGNTYFNFKDRRNIYYLVDLEQGLDPTPIHYEHLMIPM